MTNARSMVNPTIVDASFNINKTKKDRYVFIKAENNLFFGISKKEYKPIVARIGKQNSNIIWIEETALNLLYNGKYSTKILVKKSKFFPHDKRIDKTIPKYIQMYFFRTDGIKIVKNDRKTTVIPT